MNIAEQMLLDTRRQFLSRAARTVRWAALVFTFFCLIVLLLAPSLAMVVFLAMLVQVGLASLLTQRWLAHRPLDQAALPLVGGFVLTAVISWLFVPGYGVTAVQVLMLAVVLVSISSSRRNTRIASVLCGGLVIAMLGLEPSPWLLVEANAGLLVIRALVGGMALAVLWQLADQYTGVQGLALREAGQRAAEAEAARAEAATRSGEQQRLFELVQSLEVPIIPIGGDILLAPLVGSFDARRIASSQRLLLDMVAHQRAQTVILDVTGISLIDTDVARALIATALSVRLLGAQTLISGISAGIAQTLVSLGMGLDALQTVGDLGQALDLARAASQLDR